MATELLPGEHFRCLARPHWIVLARSLSWVAVVPAAVVAVSAAMRAVPGLRGAAALAPPALLLAGAIGLGVAGAAYLSWASRFVLVTDRRAVQQSGILRRRRSMVPLDRIQDVTTERGPLGALLDYGDIVVTTAGVPHPSLRLSQVRAPERVARSLFPPQRPPAHSGMLGGCDGTPQAAGVARLHGRRQVHGRAAGGRAGAHRFPGPRPVDRA